MLTPFLKYENYDAGGNCPLCPPLNTALSVDYKVYRGVLFPHNVSCESFSVLKNHNSYNICLTEPPYCKRYIHVEFDIN